jgi:ribonuclease P protein subunit RPR2
VKRSNKEKKESQQKVAKTRIEGLFKQAEFAFNRDNKLSDRYMQLAMKISLKYKVPFSKQQKIQYCKKCDSYLRPAVNARVRVSKGSTIVLCENCKTIMRFQHK